MQVIIDQRTFFRNGYADKLQKLLIRQASTLNFIRHTMNKESSKNNKNAALTIRPIFKQTSFNKQFYLVHGLDVTTSKYATILMSSADLDSARLLVDASTGMLLTIYPPWKKMSLATENRTDVYFCTSLIELSEAENNRDG